MATKKEDRNEMVLDLINKGMNYRKIGRLFKISHTVVKDINKKYNSDLLRENSNNCVLCGWNQDLIDKDHITICERCLKVIEKIR